MCRKYGCSPHYHGEGRGHIRQFLTREEKVERLKSYAEDLEKDLVAVEECHKELESYRFPLRYISLLFHHIRIKRSLSLI